MSQGIASDIEEVINEVGTEILLLERDPIVLEHVLEVETKVMSKPFNAEHFAQINSVASSVIKTGDLLQYPITKEYWRCMTTRFSSFENELYQHAHVLYKCNECVSCYRATEMRDENYDTVQRFAPVDGVSKVQSLITDKLYSSEFDDETQSFTALDVKGRILYIPDVFDIRVKDRIMDKKGRFYEVTYIEDHTFPNFNICYMTEDTRSYEAVV